MLAIVTGSLGFFLGRGEPLEPTPQSTESQLPAPSVALPCEAATSPEKNEVEEPSSVPPSFDPNVPPLPASSPKGVRLGIVLVRYSGAEMAPKETRSRSEALKLAAELLDLAKTDFDQAVKRGDVGSATDIGRVGQGILQRNLEFAAFTLEKNAVHETVLEAPNGLWIIKRTL